jgi:hypothetical protein
MVQHHASDVDKQTHQIWYLSNANLFDETNPELIFCSCYIYCNLQEQVHMLSVVRFLL